MNQHKLMIAGTNHRTASSWLILGGARSGKSGYAEQLALQSEKPVCYIATAQALDEEMASRIQHHQQDRPSHWQTLEAPLALAEALQQHSTENNCLLVDCLTMWVMNLLELENPLRMQQEFEEFLTVLPGLPGDIILVSNEVGMGIIPMGKLSRDFVDEAGRLHQKTAQAVNNVRLMVAGLPLTVKET
ncbi:MAG: Adenosylcobinamide-phosphate guanylyltransferase (EC [uncultured Thiotrichaceae bacterium]|uniref:Bifunctional adenosylcobalamin biosynthesis protein n=1 Tax=uncultured Thiotrichaceae bacterium TaxID=298394 RepID=A0A6S6S2Y4_9GAMM|nr:MAG: Adenosylcobinamide-phosphate guanylyltransferase (EC [uncultured Thiotrichaceae bacterium]